MTYWHCYLKPKASGREKPSSRNYFVVNDLGEDELRKTVVEPWHMGVPFTVGGRIIKSHDEVEEIRIVTTEQSARSYADAHNQAARARNIIDGVTDRRMLV
jgi:hypothetical protein